ncbi:hypothetical protein A7P94_07610 [Eikenella sp. NML01-A-086]|nr:hypothetical protein A7P94_07610 [Eikenella sp. NML01-A-086]
MRRDTVFGQCGQIRGIQLHGTDIVGAVFVAYPLARPAVFIACYGQQNQRIQLVLGGGLHRTNRPFLLYCRRQIYCH